MMQKHLLPFAVAAMLVACQNQSPTTAEAPPREPKTYTIEQFYKTVNTGSGAFSHDEQRLLIHTNESGIFNLAEINLADGSKKMLTNSSLESCFAIAYVGSAGDVLFSSDKGGNEIDHIFLRTAAGEIRDLTPAAKAKSNFLAWTKDKKAFFYTSNERDERFFDVLKMSVSEWKSSLIFKNLEGNDVFGISRDGKFLALGKTITTSENRFFLHDLTSKKQIEISEPSKKGKYEFADFSADGKFLLYSTDAEGEFAKLLRYDLATHSCSTEFEAKWDVMFASQTENGKFTVIGINEDGKSRLVVRDAEGKEVAFPTIPDGDVVAVNISSSESKMRLTVGTSKSPNDLYLFDFQTNKLTRLTNNLNPEIAADDLAAAFVVRFKSFDGLEIPAIYYRPLAASKAKKVPALVWVHGGPGGQSRVGYSAFIQYLVNHGYAILMVNNRGSSGYGKSFFKMDDLNHGDKDLKDCIAGKKYLQTLDYIEPQKIGIIGGSYGGYMTMAAMTFAPDEFKVGVDIFGVTNWLRTLKSIPPYWESFRAALYAELGDPTTADSVRLYNISPLFHTSKVKNPVMVLQGANDPRVLQVESDEIVAGIKKNGVPVEYVVFPDEGHGFVKKENEIRGYSQVLSFLDKHLKNIAPVSQ